jgi:hypothetical protein
MKEVAVDHDEQPLSDDVLRAFVDGELDAAAASRVQARLAHDERAVAFVRREQALRERLQAAYEPVLTEPVPDRLLAMLRPAAANDARARADVVDLAAARARRPRLAAWPTWLGIAASLLLGIAIGHRLLPAGQPVEATGGQWVAQADLARALDTQSAATRGAPVQMAVSFVDRDGRYCRSFAVSRDAMAGLACRDAGRWQLEVVARAPTTGGDYRQAASSLPNAVLQAIDARIAGAPLDAVAEAQALHRGWSH